MGRLFCILSIPTDFPFPIYELCEFCEFLIGLAHVKVDAFFVFFECSKSRDGIFRTAEAKSETSLDDAEVELTLNKEKVPLSKSLYVSEATFVSSPMHFDIPMFPSDDVGRAGKSNGLRLTARSDGFD